MLLEFKTKNYKSFNQEATFSLIPAPKQKGLDYSILTEKIKSKQVKGLSTSVIYGPNAAGKTNIIGAMDTFRAIVLRGNIRNFEEKTPNMAANVLELIPNNQSKAEELVLFSVDFAEQGLLMHYALTMELGAFLDDTFPRKITKEELLINGETIFTREENVEFGSLKSVKTYLPEAIHFSDPNILDIVQNSLNQEELFLTNGFKLIISQELVKIIIGWFTNKFMVVYRADALQLIQRFVDPKSKTIYVEKTTNDAARLFGINSNVLGYVKGEEDSAIRLFSIFEDIENKTNKAIAAEIFESYGTIRFTNIFPLVIRAILTGGTLVVDEFDASIHPMALMNIINIFHNDDINRHHAQLVFNTHNPIFLNSNLLRRDEIKFVERDEETNSSVLYSLSDFGTTGEKAVRLHEDYMKNYFISQYGAIMDIDFTPIFEELIDNEV